MIPLSLSLILACALTLALPWSRGSAQMTPQPDSGQATVTVYGDISGGHSGVQGWVVELVPCGPVARQRTTPRADGYFEFRGVTPALYEIRVTDSKGSLLHRQTVSLSQESETLFIKVPATERTDAFKTPTVSFQQLQHKVPRKAISEQKKGVSALKQRHLDVAADHFKNAVAIDPAFADAHNDLGIAYFRLKEYEPSLEHLRRAVELAPGHQPVTDNLCMLLLRMKRYAEAGQVADGALKRGSVSATAHYAAAVGVLAERGSMAAALDHLRRASSEIPNSHLLAARVLTNAGRRTDAAHELEAYLNSSQTGSERPEVEEWLADLKQ